MIPACSRVMEQQLSTTDPGFVSTLDMFQGDAPENHRKSTASENPQQRSQNDGTMPAGVRSHHYSGKSEPMPCDPEGSSTVFPYTPTKMSASNLPSTHRPLTNPNDVTHKQKHSPAEIVIEILSRQNSAASSSSEETSASSSADSGRGASDEKAWESGSGGGSDSCKDEMTRRFSTIIGSGLGKEVVVNIETNNL